MGKTLSELERCSMYLLGFALVVISLCINDGVSACLGLLTMVGGLLFYPYIEDRQYQRELKVNKSGGK